MAHTKNIDLMTLMDTFRSEEKCHEYLEELRWPDGVECPRCQGKTISRIKARSQYECDDCRYQFSVRVNTILHDSKLPLRKWFACVYMMCESKKGVSANQVKRTLKVAYKTAWYLCHRIRAAMKDANTEPLEGIIEADETYVGGRALGKGKGYKGNKTMVLGALERGGNIRLRVEKRATSKVLHRAVLEELDMGEVDAIYTDELAAYEGIDNHDGRHQCVAHSKDERVRGNVHTNSIEGAFSLFKRSIVGSYHQISAKHLPAYLDEFEFRFDNRKNPYLFRDTILRLIAADRLEYSELIAQDS